MKKKNAVGKKNKEKQRKGIGERKEMYSTEV